MKNTRRLALHLILTLSFALLPTLNASAGKITGSVKDVNGNAPSGVDGYTILVQYNDMVTSSAIFPSTSYYKVNPYSITVNPATGPDKTVKLTYARYSNPADIRVVNGIISNDGTVQTIDIEFAGAWGSGPTLKNPEPVTTSANACCELSPSCSAASRGRLFSRGPRCSR